MSVVTNFKNQLDCFCWNFASFFGWRLWENDISIKVYKDINLWSKIIRNRYVKMVLAAIHGKLLRQIVSSQYFASICTILFYSAFFVCKKLFFGYRNSTTFTEWHNTIFIINFFSVHVHLSLLQRTIEWGGLSQIITRDVIAE